MKREQIINRIKDTVKQITANSVDVFTSGNIYPKCYVSIIAENIGGYNRPGERLTPDMCPVQLLAYVQGMAAALNNKV